MRILLITLMAMFASVTALGQEKDTSTSSKVNFSDEALDKIDTINIKIDDSKYIIDNVVALNELSQEITLSGDSCNGKKSIAKIGNEKRYCLKNNGLGQVSLFTSKSEKNDGLDRIKRRGVRVSTDRKDGVDFFVEAKETRFGGDRIATAGAGFTIRSKSRSKRSQASERETARFLALGLQDNNHNRIQKTNSSR